jgi:5'-nucleotidase
MKPNILLLNDDGISAPGLKHLFRAIKEIATICVAAPVIEKSGAGLSMTLKKPLKIQKMVWEDHPRAYSISGTPADCVKLAMNSLLDTPPDLIVSGINRGSNAGRNVLYSGTVGGVIEGVYRNSLPGIAFSSHDFANPDFEHFEKYIPAIISYFLENKPSQGTLINVNFPSLASGPVKGIKMARQGRGFWTDNPDKRQHPEGEHYFWLGGKWRHFDEHPDSDVHLLQQGYITAVPIHVDELTDHRHLEQHREAFELNFEKLFQALS